jgi:hypothetical protein
MSARTPHLAAMVAALLVGACAGGPPVPDWQINARSALDHALVAYLQGNARVEAAETQSVRRAIGASGRVDLLARAELARCAARVASLSFEDCPAFEALRADAAPAERTYADYLGGRARAQDVALLPPVHRPLVALSGDAAAGALRGIDDPLSRLVAAGVLLRAGRANPAVIDVAVDTASAQGWRRPLLAWLTAQLALAEKAGASAEVERLKRRIAVVQAEVSAP